MKKTLKIALPLALLFLVVSFAIPSLKAEVIAYPEMTTVDSLEFVEYTNSLTYSSGNKVSGYISFRTDNVLLPSIQNIELYKVVTSIKQFEFSTNDSGTSYDTIDLADCSSWGMTIWFYQQSSTNEDITAIQYVYDGSSNIPSYRLSSVYAFKVEIGYNFVDFVATDTLDGYDESYIDQDLVLQFYVTDSPIDGYYLGYTEGLADGYENGREDYGSYIDGEWKTYQDGFDLARLTFGELILGVWYSYQDGYELGRSEYGYFDGEDWLSYSDGYTAGQIGENALYNFIPAVIGPMFAFFFQVASFRVMGFSAMDLIAGLAVIGVALTIFKVFLSK